jgi:hypothetical protein
MLRVKMLLRLFRKNLIPLVVIPMIASCGYPVRAERSEPPVLLESEEDQEVSVHNLQDPSCQKDATAVSIARYQGWFWNGSTTEAQSYPALDIVSNQSLSSQAIISTWYGQQQHEKCALQGSEIVCTGSTVVTQGAVHLKICRAEAYYARESVEGVALTGMHQINLAWKYYHSLVGSYPSMGRTNLLVLPEITQNYQVIKDGVTQERSYVTASNLAYVAMFKRAPTFVIYPTAGRDSPNGSLEKLNLWESVWGMAHEFGHHVLRTHSGKASLEANARYSAEPVEVPRVVPVRIGKGNDHAPKLTADGRSVTAADHWQAINEGFADLFAFYSLNQRPELPKNIPCLNISRDVLASQFASGRPKILDSIALGQYELSDYIAPDNCNAPFFQSPHSIGAVVAYGVNRLFQASGLISRAGPTRAGELLLAWAEKLRVIANGDERSITLSAMVRLAVDVAADSGNSLTAEQCKTLKEVFPVWQEEWIAGNATTQSFQCD